MVFFKVGEVLQEVLLVEQLVLDGSVDEFVGFEFNDIGIDYPVIVQLK